jgi:hypothetical protein
MLIPPISVVLLSACSTLSVNYDYNQQVDLQDYKTYDWLPIPDNIDVDPLNRDRFIKAVSNNLDAKGFSQNTDQPDFLIATHFGKKREIQVTDWGYTYAPIHRYRGYGYLNPGVTTYPGVISTSNRVSVHEYEKGTLILDFIDANHKTLIWRATARAIVNPSSNHEKQTERINKAVSKILLNFPPQ